MLRLNLASPYEDGIGYGICGTNLAIELARRDDVDVNITCHTERAGGSRPVESAWLAPRIRPTAEACDPDLPTLYVQDVGPRPAGEPVIHYTCLDTEYPSAVRRACYAEMDVLVGMSAWNRTAFESAGFTDVEVIPQGIDPTVFFPRPVERRVFGDRFVVFSGGKLEYRKGQDIVLAAWKVFHARHPDALLVAGWYNAWPQSMATLARTALINVPTLSSHDDLPALLHVNGIDPESVILQGPLPNWAYASVYHQCDCGLFPTRAEPATNMPMAEMMACGRPVIGSFCAGQVDLLDPGVNARGLTELGREPVPYHTEDGDDLGRWWTPSVEEVLAELEWCYAHRDAAATLGAAAAADLHGRLTWAHVADRFVALGARCAAPA